MGTVTYYYKVVPSNNPEFKGGYSYIVSKKKQTVAPKKDFWSSRMMTKEEAKEGALAWIQGDALHYIGNWEIKVEELE